MPGASSRLNLFPRGGICDTAPQGYGDPRPDRHPPRGDRGSRRRRRTVRPPLSPVLALRAPFPIHAQTPRRDIRNTISPQARLLRPYFPGSPERATDIAAPGHGRDPAPLVCAPNRPSREVLSRHSKRRPANTSAISRRSRDRPPPVAPAPPCPAATYRPGRIAERVRHIGRCARRLWRPPPREPTAVRFPGAGGWMETS